MPRSNIQLGGQELKLDADSDTSITVDTDDQIDIKVGGTDVATFTNSSSNFVITQAVQDKAITFKGDDNGSPVTALTLDMSDAGTAIFNHDITLDGKITGASQVTQDVNTSSLALAGGTDSNVGANMIVYGGSHSSLAGVVRFRNGSTETARILSGGGITFNGDTATANALDDYEEGTFSPTYVGDTSNPTVSFTTQIGRYTKVGRQVHIIGFLNVSTVSGGGGGLSIGSLPFQNGSTTYVAATVGYVESWSTSTNCPTRLLCHPSDPKINLYRQSTSDPRSPMERVQVGNLANGCQIYFSAVYITA